MAEQTRRAGLRLPRAVRRKMESFFGADFATVRVHLATRPLPCGALALTAGEEIWFAPGCYDPAGAAGQTMLAHELTHVLQQRELARDGDGAACAIVFDRALEAEADRLGARAAAWRPGRPRAAAELSARRRHARPCRAAAMAQPWIRMAKDTDDDPTRYGTPGYEPKLSFKGYFLPESQRGKPINDRYELLTSYSDTRAKVNAALKFLFGEEIDSATEAILQRWMGKVDPPRPELEMVGDVLQPWDNNLSKQYGYRRQANVQAELKYFFTYGELAWALKQEVALEQESGADSLKAERQMAANLLDDPNIALDLRDLATQAHFLLSGRKLDLPGAPAYAPLHGEMTFADLIKSLTRARGMNVAELVARLHDVKDLMQHLQIIGKDEPSFQLWLRGGRKLTIHKIGMRYNLGTPDEADEWVLFMRERKRAVWAGPSYTMLHMWWMAQKLSAKPGQMVSLACAMFAYWCLRYPHTATPVHRFHETFAAAHLFKLPYDPEDSVVVNCTRWRAEKSSKL